MNIQELQTKLQGIVKELSGEVALSFKIIDSSEEININEQTQLWAASVIKIFIAITFFKQLSEDKFSLSTKTKIKQENNVKGSGIVHLLDSSMRYTYLDLVKLMLILSDNAATNEIIDLVGWENIGANINSQGLLDTTFKHKMFITSGRGPNLTTTSDLVKILDLLHHKKLPGSDEILEIMNEEKVRTRIPLYLPNSLRIPHKTGSLPEGLHDVGIVYAAKPFILCFMSDSQVDKIAATSAVAHISKLCYDFASQ